MQIVKEIKNQLKFILIRTRSVGFTLIEVTIGITIIIIMTSLFLADYHSTNRKQELVATAQTLVSDIRLAQNFGLGYKELNGVSPTYGWGVYFDKNNDRYILFVPDLNDFDTGLRDADGSEDFKVVNLPDSLAINSIYTDSGFGPTLYTGLYQQVVFLPPEPRVYITDDPLNIGMLINLKDVKTEDVKTIRINFFGLVEIIE